MNPLLLVLLLVPSLTMGDPKLDSLSTDLRALGRVTAVAQDLERNRQVLLAIIDDDIKTLREARNDGTYHWASLQREEASRVKDEKTVEQVQSERELRNVTVTAPNAYRVEVTVPKKRSLVSENNRVYVRDIIVDSTGFDGQLTHSALHVNAWVNPGDSTGLALPAIGKSVRVTAELGVESGNKKAVAEVALVQAKLVDDPTSPYFPAVRRLLQIRDFAAASDIDRGHLKNAVDEALLALPGELEKRAAEQKALLDSDVVKALPEIARLLGGTPQEQADGRARLGELVAKLR
jgi:hypothetical protein